MKFFLLAVSINFLSFFTLMAQGLYDIDHITSIEITFEQENWDALLNQYKQAGNDERLLASAMIDGVLFDSIGVRYKGNATYSANNDKNPLNIKLDYVLDQHYQGFETLKLSNGYHDPSFVREVLSYEIARKYMVAPLSNYTKVFINGQYHGLYSNSESINGDFGQRYLYADGDNFRVKCNSDGGGFSSASSLEYLGADSSLYYNFYDLKSDYGWAALAELIAILTNEPEEVESILDIDKAIWMLAFDNVLVNLDSYIGRKANYYLIKDDNGIVHPVLWDMNESLGGFEQLNQGPPSINGLINMSPFLHEGDSAYPLIKLVLENDTYRRMYIAHCRTILEENLSNGWYEDRAYDLQEIIDAAVTDDPNTPYSYNDFRNNITSNINNSGGGPGGGGGGAQGAFGLTPLFSGRVDYLSSHSAFLSTQPQLSDRTHSPAAPEAMAFVDINITAENANTVFLNYRNLPSQPFTHVQMFDDGNHQDGAANDGKWGAQIPTDITDVQYYFYAENEEAGAFLPLRAAHEFFQLEVGAFTADVAINEFMADNETTVTDQDGEYDDWIELYNNTDEAISLAGYFLSDDAEDPSQWAFPDTSIQANGYLIIWADKDEDQNGLHADFKLSKDGETILLSNSDTVLLDQIIFGGQTADLTTGRYPNGTGDFAEMSPTFEAENSMPTNVEGSIEAPFGMSIFPNPAADFFKVQSDFDGIQELLIYDELGRMIWWNTFTKEKSISCASWPAGMYFLKFTNTGEDNSSFTTTLMIE